MEEIWQELAARASAAFGISVTPDAIGRLGSFLGLLEKWSAKSNLVSAATREELIWRHLFDSLSPAVFLAPGDRFGDVGSGAGLPGIPLAIVHPPGGWLIESRRRRTTFLRHACRTIPVSNVRVFEGRAEDFVEPMDSLVGRAIRENPLFALGRRVLAPGGKVIAMKKPGQPIEVPQDFEHAGSRGYELPGGERHEVILFTRCST